MKNITLSILLVSLAFLSVTGTAASKGSGLKNRLEALSQSLEKKRQEFHVPGMAIAIVKDDKLVFSRGYGVSNLEKNTPVTANTAFGIGSTTKAFTSTLIGILVDEGKMNWDDPITKHLPYLQFKMKNETDKITIKDMLSHQTGFTRFDLLYANGKVPRDEVLKAATNAEPWGGFREKFLYTNLMYIGAGVAVAKSAGTDWDSLLEKRLLKPLGMKNTTSRYQKQQKNRKHSRGYMWLEEENKHKLMPMHDHTNIAPAGGINSTVKDMSKWLTLQLANGVYKGKRIITGKQLLETRSPQIKMSQAAQYGLGWMLFKYKDQPVIAHEGSVQGYSAIVAFLPESDVGFVLLTNLTTTGLLAESMNLVWETLMSDDEPKSMAEAEKPTVSYEKYLGEYIANFGPFTDTIFTFHMKDGKPHVDVPGQTDYELKAPDENGKMSFVLTDTIAISFDHNQQGNVTAMRMYQGGMKFDIRRKGVEIIAEVSLDELQKYLGEYQSNLFKGKINVIIQNNRLALDVPNQMVFELHVPDNIGRREFRVRSVMSAKFETDNNNKITALGIFKGDEKLDTAMRINSGAREQLPTVDEILKLRQTKKRSKALISSGGFRFKGKIIMKQSGVTGTVVTSVEGTDRFLEDVDFGKFGRIKTAMHPDGAATDYSFASLTQHKGKYLEQSRKAHPAAMINWRDFYENIKVVSKSTIQDKDVYIVKLSGGKTPAVKIYIDTETGNVLMQKSNLLIPGMGDFLVTTTFENYKEIYGLRVPFKITTSNDFQGTSVIEYEIIEAGLTFKPALFILKNNEAGD